MWENTFINFENLQGFYILLLFFFKKINNQAREP